MNLPGPVRLALEARLEELGVGRLVGAEPVGGGCIADARLLRVEGEREFFLKWSDGSRLPAALFAAEAASLAALRQTGVIRVPEVIDVRDPAPSSTPAEGGRWLLLEWLEPGAANSDSWHSLGRALAALHRHRAATPGWPADNFIGTLPQRNGDGLGWAEFWRVRRLQPQVELAARAGSLDASETLRFERLFGELDQILGPAEQDGASLLHGDLWSGNVHVLRSGEPALVDPSSFHGHREVDLAMSELFGGFGQGFSDAYSEAWPLLPGYAETRRAAYQLYYLLVHINLFGGGYRKRTLATLRSIGF